MEIGNALNWFEIPVQDFDRAKKFYETLFDFQMPEMQLGDSRMGFFLYDMPGGKVGGAIVAHPDMQPSETGSLIYLNCQPDLTVVLNRVEKAGGSILQPKTKISEEQELGFTAFMRDSEGNKVGLHSMG